MFQKLCAVAAWAFLIFIIYATLGPLGIRPELTASETGPALFIERFGAYGVLGALCALGYPRRLVLVCLLIFGGAIILEFLQLFIPDRDARLVDAAEKLAGAAAGIITVRVFPFHRLWRGGH